MCKFKTCYKSYLKTASDEAENGNGRCACTERNTFYPVDTRRQNNKKKVPKMGVSRYGNKKKLQQRPANKISTGTRIVEGLRGYHLSQQPTRPTTACRHFRAGTSSPPQFIEKESSTAKLRPHSPPLSKTDLAGKSM